MAGRSSDEPHPLDIALGARVRLRRKELRMSQGQLACALGITFQQIQKYEHGTNRISFSRLVGICEVLECSLADLISEIDKTRASRPKLRQFTQLTAPGAMELLDAYGRLSSQSQRRALLNLARQLSREGSKD
jgi:transcriptional regulator with XRE-family HTH domain